MFAEALARRLNSKSRIKEHRLKESSKPKVYPINMWTPELDGVRIESYDYLVEVLRSRSPAFFKRKDADNLLRSAKLHIELYQEYSNRTHLEKGEVAALAKKLKISPTTLKRYLREGVMPKIYYWSNMVSSTDKEKKLERLLARLNGVTTEEEYDRRYSTLYFSDEMSITANHRAYDESARKLLRFIKEYTKSGLLVNLARRLKIGKSTIQAWLDGTQLPTRVAYASLIPQEAPRKGWKWLPKRLNPVTNLPEDFIQVPEQITSPQDLLDVLKQLFPLDTKTMKKLEKELGKMSQEIAFMYLLGLMVSDGTFKSDVDYSASAEVFVSKKYSWGPRLGKGFCYTLGKIGLSASRKPDQERTRENGKINKFRVYNSEASPVLMWMKKALLGLSASDLKKNVPIKSEWIPDMPHEWKVAFIQGLADGDGHASIRRFDAAINTTTNEKFFSKLLLSVGVASTYGDNRARIKQQNEVVKARELPLFRFASGRQDTLDDLSKIIKLKPRGRKRVPEDEKELVMRLYESGLKAGEIVERLWYEHGIARTIEMIDTLIRREKKNADSK